MVQEKMTHAPTHVSPAKIIACVSGSDAHCGKEIGNLDKSISVLKFLLDD